jgi:hypothetical protein
VQPCCAAKRGRNCGRFTIYNRELINRVIKETNMHGSFFVGIDYQAGHEILLQGEIYVVFGLLYAYGHCPERDHASAQKEQFPQQDLETL